MTDTQTVAYFNANDSVTGRDGGPYLDVLQAQEDEKRRAHVEKREPNLDNPPPNAGIQLNNAAQQLATADVNNLPSQSAPNGPEFGWLKSASDDNEKLLSSVVELEIKQVEVPEEETPEPAGPELTYSADIVDEAEVPVPENDPKRTDKKSAGGRARGARTGKATAKKTAAKRTSAKREIK